MTTGIGDVCPERSPAGSASRDEVDIDARGGAVRKDLAVIASNAATAELTGCKLIGANQFLLSLTRTFLRFQQHGTDLHSEKIDEETRHPALSSADVRGLHDLVKRSQPAG
jgi:hypothetical protein